MDFTKFHSTNLKKEFIKSIKNETNKLFKMVPLAKRLSISFYKGSASSMIIEYDQEEFEIEEGELIYNNEEYWILLDKLEKIKELGGKPTKEQTQKLKELDGFIPISKKDVELINNFCTKLSHALWKLDFVFIENASTLEFTPEK